MGSSTLGTRRCPLYGVRGRPLLGGFNVYYMGSSIGGSATVRSRGRVCTREGLLSEVPLYICTHTQSKGKPPENHHRDYGMKIAQLQWY